MSSDLTIPPFVQRPLGGASQHRPADKERLFSDFVQGMTSPPRHPEFPAEENGMEVREVEVIQTEFFDVSPQESAERVSFRDPPSLITRFEKLCKKYSILEHDLEALQSRLTQYDTLVALYNDFDGQKRAVENIKEAFTQVFTSLSPGRGFEGKFRSFFKHRICKLEESYLINQWSACMLLQLAAKSPETLPQKIEREGQMVHNDEQDIECDRGDFDNPRGRKAPEDKGWLVAAMVLGLMASYPLILQPAYQVAGDLFRRARGTSGPKVQG